MKAETFLAGNTPVFHSRDEGRRTQGFTLIEVLVVVAIIALLIAILVPSMVKVRQQTRRIHCQSNLRQIMQAWHYYIEESKGHFPSGAGLDITFGGKIGDRYANDPPPAPPRPLNKHLNLPSTPRGKDVAEVFWCPSDRDNLFGEFDPEGGEIFRRLRYFDHYGNSYRANRYMIGKQPPDISEADPCYEALTDALSELGYAENTTVTPALTHQSRLVIVGDHGWSNSWYGPPPAFPPPQWHGQRSQKLHSYWHNIGFLDGHAAFTEIIRGIHVSADYTVIPFKALHPAFTDCQIRGSF